jgi:hypothetical protein
LALQPLPIGEIMVCKRSVLRAGNRLHDAARRKLGGRASKRAEGLAPKQYRLRAPAVASYAASTVDVALRIAGIGVRILDNVGDADILRGVDFVTSGVDAEFGQDRFEQRPDRL